MNRFTILTTLAAIPVLAQTLTLAPGVITTCSSPGFGHTQIFWNAGGTSSVQLTINGTGIGLEPPEGSSLTGDWVQDGTLFVLAAAGGQPVASATARVVCRPPSVPVPSALSASSYFPLDVGDEWVYRVDNRFGTAIYETRRAERAEMIDGTLYYIVSSSTGPTSITPALPPTEIAYRIDDQGRVFFLNQQGGEQLLLDPTGTTSGALLKVLTKGQPVQTTVGNFADALTYDLFNALLDERGTYARGIGFVSSSEQLLTGSSGGFVEGYNLVYARIAGNLVFAAPAAALELTTESRDLDVSGHNVTNCAIPCYYAACGLGSPVDPPGTYKPCIQARVRMEESPASFTASDPQTRTVAFDLLDSSGAVLSSATDAVTIGPDQPEAIVAHSILLPMIPGPYRLRARILDASNMETDSSSLSLQVR